MKTKEGEITEMKITGEKYDLRPEEYKERLELPGRIYPAKVHRSAQKLYKIKRMTRYTKFCKCCLLPGETVGGIVPFTYCDKQEEFGLGISIYIRFIKYCILIAFITLCLASIPSMVFSNNYSSDLKKYCKITVDRYFNGSANDYSNITFLSQKNCDLFLENCKMYLEQKNDSLIDLKNITQTYWILDLSVDSLKYYDDIYACGAEDGNKIKELWLQYSFMYFLVSITILIAGFLFILYLNLLEEGENIEKLEASDYALLIHGVPKPQNGKTFGDINMELHKIVNQVISPEKKYQIIPCLKIGDIFDLVKERYEAENQRFQIFNSKKQKVLNKKNGYSGKNLQYFNNIICIKRTKSLKEIEKNIRSLEKEIDMGQREIIEEPNKYNSGVFFIVFNEVETRNYFYDFFPKLVLTKIFWSIKYFFCCLLCGCCTDERRKNLIRLKLSISVERPTEAYEVLWENLGYSRREKFIRFFISFVFSLTLIVVCLFIVIGLNSLQTYLNNKGWDENGIWGYVISLFISIIIAVTNIVGKILLEKLTEFEKKETRTDFVISFAAKLTIFTFVNTAILPLVSNYIRNGWGNNHFLLSNLLMIFILNILIPPLIFYLGPDFAIKTLKREKAKFDLKYTIDVEDSPYTQGELNEIFENVGMDICFKYSYVSNCILVSLFYLSIFPLGIAFGLVGLILCYFLEILYLGFYTRPQVLSVKICKFFVGNTKIAVAIFAIGNYIFLGEIRGYGFLWGVLSLILFLVIIFIPYEEITIDFLDIENGMSGYKYETYNQKAIYYSIDYERLNPVTKSEGMEKYFKKLSSLNIIENEYETRISEDLQRERKKPIEAYLKISRNGDNLAASHLRKTQFIEQEISNALEGINNINEKKKNLRPSINSSVNSLPNLTKEDVYIFEEDLTYKSSVYNAVTSALIYIYEKNIDSKFNHTKNENYNPWKTDIFTKNFKSQMEEDDKKIRTIFDFNPDEFDFIKRFDIEDNNGLFSENQENNLIVEREKNLLEDKIDVNILEHEDHSIKSNNKEMIKQKINDSEQLIKEDNKKPLIEYTKDYLKSKYLNKNNSILKDEDWTNAKNYIGNESNKDTNILNKNTKNNDYHRIKSFESNKSFNLSK